MKRALALALVAILGAAALTGCCPLLESATDDGGDSGGGVSEVSAPSLEEFLDADTKTGSYTFHYTWADGNEYDLTGEFWVDGRLFRWDIYEDGELVRAVVSPDGETAYFVRHDEQICEPSVAGVDYYLMRYTMPEGKGIEDGTDEESGATRIVYTVRKTDTMAGADGSWYAEDFTYLVKDDAVIGVISRGANPEDDGSIGGLDVSRELWTDVKSGVPIPADTFELPYPIQEAE